MDVIAIVKLSINQKFISDDPEKVKEQLTTKKLTWEQWKVQRAKEVVKAIKNQAVQVKSGLYENLMSGTIIEVKEVKQKGKVLYPPVEQDKAIDLSHFRVAGE